MDIIFLHDFKVETLIGVYDWERTQPQTLKLDLDIALPNQSACFSDNIHDTIHYGELSDAIIENLKIQEFTLLEALAEFIANLILEDFNAPWVRVRVEKLGILPSVKHVGIQIERGKITIE